MTLKGTINLEEHYEMLLGSLGKEYEWPLTPGKNIEILDPVALSVARHPVAGASLSKDYVVFAGGYTNASSDIVDIFDADFVRNSNCTLFERAEHLAGASLGDTYAVFAGGYPGEDVVNIFDKNFTRINTTLSAKRTDLAGTKLGKNYVIFTGGYTRGEEYILTADIFDVDFIRTTISIFTVREKFTGASLGDEYAVFAGGWGDYYINGTFYLDTLDVFDTNFTLNSTFTLSAKRQQLAGASLGKDYVVFAGGLGEIVEEDGYVEEAIIDNVDIFNMDFTRTVVSLSSERFCLSGASLGDDYVVFAGGDGYGDSFSKTVDIFNKDFVRDNSYNLSVGRWDLTGASLGNEYAVFAGGWNWNYNGHMDVVDIIGLEKISKKIDKNMYKVE